MKVIDIPRGEARFSLEMFPPKSAESLPNFIEKAHSMELLNPDFISVTYGAGGGTKDTTLELAKSIRRVPVVAHLNCDGLTRSELFKYLDELIFDGIENILALRGDCFDSKDFSGSLDLIRTIKEYSRGKLCIGAACYPEGHPDSQGFDADMEFNRRKVEAGCSFFATQMCFNTNKIVSFVEKFHKEVGSDIRVRVDLMPVLKNKTIEKAISLGVSVPEGLQYIVDNTFAGREDFVRCFGIDYCARQIKELISAGIKDIHLYTMNDYEATKEIILKSGLSYR